jgi:Na+/H+ antiporter NhaA
MRNCYRKKVDKTYKNQYTRKILAGIGYKMSIFPQIRNVFLFAVFSLEIRDLSYCRGSFPIRSEKE